MYIIAKDGSGDFTSIQAAIDAIPAGRRHPTILLLRMDEYRERVVVNKDNVRIVGEARDRTVIVNAACAHDLNDEGQEKGTFLSYTFLVTGRNVEVENLTIRNDAGDGSVAGQAVAVYAAGDRGVWRNVRMIACQDTLFCGPTMPKVARDALPRVIPQGVPSVGDCPPVTGRQYFENCFIQGDVDFIFGPYTCWFEGCTLHMNKRGGYYTAANTPEGVPHGLIFHRCHLTGECGAGEAYLGRPWRQHAHTVFLDCEMDECVAPEGFQDWGEKRITRRCGEYGTTGARADQTPRHPGAARLTQEEAALMIPQAVIGSCDGWDPTKRTPTWFLCGDGSMADKTPELYPETGWGTALESLAGVVFVENCAAEGSSAKSFATSKRLGFIELCLRRGDKLLVQFGLCDGLETAEHATHARVTYPAYLNLYIDAARRQGAEPVLLTPAARLDAEGKPVRNGGDRAAAMRDLACQRGVRLIDMEAASEALLSRLREGAKELFVPADAGDVRFSLAGAVQHAQIALRLMEGATV